MKRSDCKPRRVKRLSAESRRARSTDYALADLEAMRTMSVGQADDLKVDTGDA